MENETLKLADDMSALGREYGKKAAKKRLDQIIDQEFEKAKKGIVIDLTSLWCASESVGKIKEKIK